MNGIETYSTVQQSSTEIAGDWRRVADDIVVTRDASNEARSYFRDDKWNIEAYGFYAPARNLHFKNLCPADALPILALTSKTQVKQVVYFLMHEASEAIPAPYTLSGKLTALRAFSNFSARRSLSLYEAMSSISIVLDYIYQCDPNKAQRLHAILVHLHGLGVSRTGVSVPLRELHAPMMMRFAERADDKQHAVIPSRIYHHFLTVCESHLDTVETALTKLIAVVEAIYDDAPLPPLTEDLRHVFNFWGRLYFKGQLSPLIGDITNLCQMVVIAFTGMRSAEAASLPYNCLKMIRVDGVEHYALEGFTTKFVGGRPKRTSWVTSFQAARAVRVAQRLAATAHRRFGAHDWQSCRDRSHLLFCRMGLRRNDYDGLRPSRCDTHRLESLRERAFLPIADVDFAELKQIDPFRAWDVEPEYALGTRWPIKRHQLRRSLALYAHRSGIVTPPSLKRQLQHLTKEMSMYYARGSAFAKNLLQDDKHFAHEWNEAAGLSAYLGYAAEVLFSNEKLFGGHVAWTQSDPVLQSPVSVYSRKQAIEMFERGQRAYKETVLGGCASTEPCKSSPLNWLPVECLKSNCRSLIVAPSKLERVIKAQRRQVARLKEVAQHSVEHRLESEVLASLLTAQSDLVKRSHE